MSGAVLVTGGDGFIGRRVVAAFARDGATVHCLVRAGSKGGKAPPGHVERHELPSEPGALTAIVERLRPEVLVNLATYGVAPDQLDPRRMVEANVGLVTELIDACRSLRPRFLQIGSCSEYARTERPRLIDEQTRCVPTTPYGAAKHAATLWGGALARRFEIPFFVLRPFGVYGPGESPHRLVPYVASRLARDQTAALTPGDQVRDFSYVDDVASAILAASKRELESGTAYNLCTGVGTSVRELALAVCERLGKPASLLDFGARPYRPGDDLWIVGDPTRFRLATGFMPETPLALGIESTLSAAAAHR